MNTKIKVLFAGLSTTILHYLGGMDHVLEMLIVFMVVDYLMGVLKAGHQKKLNSMIGLKGIIKKMMYLCIVAVAVQLDILSGGNGWIRNACIMFFVANEGLSIMENYASCGYKTPKFIKDRLEQLIDKSEKDGSKDVEDDAKNGRR